MSFKTGPIPFLYVYFSLSLLFSFYFCFIFIFFFSALEFSTRIKEPRRHFVRRYIIYIYQWEIGYTYSLVANTKTSFLTGCMPYVHCTNVLLVSTIHIYKQKKKKKLFYDQTRLLKYVVTLHQIIRFSLRPKRTLPL